MQGIDNTTSNRHTVINGTAERCFSSQLQVFVKWGRMWPASQHSCAPWHFPKSDFESDRIRRTSTFQHSPVGMRQTAAWCISRQQRTIAVKWVHHPMWDGNILPPVKVNLIRKHQRSHSARFNTLHVRAQLAFTS